MNNIIPSEVVFFLGAGASVAAGVPTTYDFVEKFKENIEDDEKRRTVLKILDVLGKWRNEKIDIEIFLETLIKLKNKEEESVIQFYEGGQFVLGDFFEKQPIIDDLKDFIKKKAIVESEKIDFLEPLRNFVLDYGVIDIISLNYDICVEQFCNINKLNYQDGFDVHWNPNNFLNTNTEIRLYKLHGSVMWYQSDRGFYIKLPVMSNVNKIQLITGEKAENLMLYPMQKWNYAEPLLELLVESKRLIEKKECKFLIVVGYSFRDEHIKRILWDIARKNKNLQIILIDPNAYEIYTEKLKFYDKGKEIPSSFYERVVCLPYSFEKVFPHLKNKFIAKLRESNVLEETLKMNASQGQKTNRTSLLKNYLDSAHVEKAEALLVNIDFHELIEDRWLLLEIYFKFAFYEAQLINNKTKTKTETYMNKFHKELSALLISKTSIKIINANQELCFEFLYNCTYDDFQHVRTYQAPDFILRKIEEFKKYIESRMDFLNFSSIKKINDAIHGLILHFDLFRNKSTIRLSEYKKNRRFNEECFFDDREKILKNEADLIKNIIGVLS